MHLDPRHIAQDLKDQAADHSAEKAPGSISDTEAYLAHQDDGEDGEVGGVGRERWEILKMSLGKTACFEGAEGVGDDGVCEETHLEEF